VRNAELELRKIKFVRALFVAQLPGAVPATHKSIPTILNPSGYPSGEYVVVTEVMLGASAAASAAFTTNTLRIDRARCRPLIFGMVSPHFSRIFVASIHPLPKSCNAVVNQPLA
jgi:hypothetical protein